MSIQIFFIKTKLGTESKKTNEAIVRSFGVSTCISALWKAGSCSSIMKNENIMNVMLKIKSCLITELTRILVMIRINPGFGKYLQDDA